MTDTKIYHIPDNIHPEDQETAISEWLDWSKEDEISKVTDKVEFDEEDENE